MTTRISRRELLRGALLIGAQLGIGAGAIEVGHKALDLKEQSETWGAAAAPNQQFLAGHRDILGRLEFGGSFAPEQWPLHDAGASEALAALEVAVHDLGLRRLRLGIRWNRAVDAQGNVDLSDYAPYLDYCAAKGVELCLNIGPLRTFRWPEEHVPGAVLDGLARLPAKGAVVKPGEAIAVAAVEYAERLLALLSRQYGGAIDTVQVENEPFYPLGEHRWLLSSAYLRELIQRVNAAFPEASILLTSAGRLNLHAIRDVYRRLLSEEPAYVGRLVSGFDFHYKTPLRDSLFLVRHFDQISYARPLAPSLSENIRDARDAGYRIEVTEAQAEPYGHFSRPGNSAKDFRYLVLRCVERVLDPSAPALLRIWGVEELTKKMLRGELTDEHRQIIELVQTVNAAARVEPEAQRARAN